MTEQCPQIPTLDNYSGWADFWRCIIGVNVIPADTEKKRTYENWKEWQEKPITDEIHDCWKSENAFSRGMAVILGEVFHRPDRKGQGFIFIDADNQKAIEEICRILGIVVKDKPYESIQQLAEDFLVEQHEDDSARAHIYFYAKKTLSNKSSNKNNPTLSPKLIGNEIPSLEIKSNRGIAYCSPSYHIHGHRYQISRNIEPITLDDEQIDKLQENFIILCKGYGIEYADAYVLTNNTPPNTNEDHNAQEKSNEHSTFASKLWQADTIVYRGHNRHVAMLSLMDSLLLKLPNESEEFVFRIAEMKNRQMCKDENGNPAPLSQEEMLSLLKQAKTFAAKKIEERQIQKEDSAKRTEKQNDEDTRPRQSIQKFSLHDMLAEAVLIGGQPCFLSATVNGPVDIQRSIELEDKVLMPLDKDAYINKPYSFLSEDHVKSCIDNAKQASLDTLYHKTKSIWKKYVDADDFYISLCALDTIYTYFQDKIGLTHYLFFVGNVGSGKSNNLRILQYLAYRNMTSTDITSANIYQFLGSMEEGQGTICEDEADDIDDDKDKMRIYKNGYTTGYPVLRTDTTYGRKQYRFHTFCFKAFAAERTPDSTKAKGFNQRIIQLTSLYGFPQYDISEVINPAG
ncbi:MAG: bifunctional DNA primase/polymerase, partial [Thermoproteota archaeon]|nr:bifunctional DNA primase/polymerase [Thermoproteota archaeon]